MSFTFENENSEFSVTVNTINDIFVEGDEQFTGNLVLGGFGTALLAPDVATVTISGNEPNDSEFVGYRFLPHPLTLYTPSHSTHPHTLHPLTLYTPLQSS